LKIDLIRQAEKADSFERNWAMASYTQPQNDIYTGLLAISLGALLTGMVFLWLDWSQYSSKKPEAVPSPGQIKAAAPTAPPPGVPK
jgi:hypothetical protein